MFPVLNVVSSKYYIGQIPNGTRKKIRLLKPLKPFKKGYVDSRRNYIDPFFGEMVPNELTPTLIEKYIESRWGKDKDGNLQAMERTFKGEMMVNFFYHRF